MPDNRRPTSLTILAIFILGLAIWNGLRLVQAVVFWPILTEFHSSPGPLYLAVSGGFWLLAGFSIVVGLWKAKAWAWYLALGGVPSYTCWYWLDRAFLQEPHSNWPFALVLTMIFISLFGILFRRNVRRYYFTDKQS
jgi:hypothetical protein